MREWCRPPKIWANCPQLEERGYFAEIEHPVMGRLRVPGEMFRLPECPWSLRRTAPMLGQHNKEVYCEELGLSQGELVNLRQLGAI